jgi:hypothetical protein
MEITKPLLIETMNKYLIKKSLREVRTFKNYYITLIVNVSFFILFVGGIALILYYRYKGKLTPEEKEAKEKLKKQYLFEKLHKISYEKRKEQQNLITDLPII